MQDQPSTYSRTNPQFPEQEHQHLKCPRCDSLNTKFCYYNNYNLSQPRYFCKSCRRYWTKGGTLRNIPVGGGSRKNTRRSSNPKRSSSNSTPQSARPKQKEEAASKLYRDDDPSVVEIGRSFSSLLEANGGQFGGNMLEGLNSNGSAPTAMGDSGLDHPT